MQFTILPKQALATSRRATFFPVHMAELLETDTTHSLVAYRDSADLCSFHW
jgi:hypothetical protein